MKQWICKCDICGEEKPEKELYRIKVKSASFINYVNYDEIFADRRTIDICDICVARFKDFVKRERKKHDIN